MAVTSALAVGTRERGEAAAWQSLSVHNKTQNWLTIQQTLPIQRSSLGSRPPPFRARLNYAHACFNYA